jgi:hypothetical protein
MTTVTGFSRLPRHILKGKRFSGLQRELILRKSEKWNHDENNGKDKPPLFAEQTLHTLHIDYALYNVRLR